MEAARPMRPWTFRVENIPSKTTAEGLKGYFHTEDQPYIQVRSIVPAVDCEDLDGELTATISFQTRDETITTPRILDDTISVDSDFHGFTPLGQPKGPITADVIAVTGLAAHAYGSWAHSSHKMWLRDYLPKDVANARVLIYGYPSQLQGSASSGILADHTNNFIHRLLSMRELARCQDRPIVFIGHSLGCLIIKKALSDVNGSVGRYSSRLPVCAIIFFGAPHRGLQTAALETLVKSRPTEMMIGELRARSPTLNELNDKFRYVANDIEILTCFERCKTKTAVEMPDGSWKREGTPEMMVYQDSAQLYFPKETMVSCHADHSQIAKLRRGESGAYPDIKRAVKQALLRVAEEQANVGLSRLQLQPGANVFVGERLRHNGDYFKGSGPERTPVPAGKSPLDDAQSQVRSISEPPEKITRVLHDKEVVSAPSSPTSDGRENGFIVQNKQALSIPTITLPSAQSISRDVEELPKGDTEAPKPSMQYATDALSDRSKELPKGDTETPKPSIQRATDASSDRSKELPKDDIEAPKPSIQRATDASSDRSKELPKDDTETPKPSIQRATDASSDRSKELPKDDTETPKPSIQRATDALLDRSKELPKGDTETPKPSIQRATDASSNTEAPKPSIQHTTDTSSDRSKELPKGDIEAPKPSIQHTTNASSNTEAPKPSIQRTTDTSSNRSKKLPKGDTEAPKPLIQCATDASSDHSNALSSPMKKKSPDKAIGSVKDPKLRLDLCSASQEGGIEKVRSLLAQGCSIHESSEDLVDPDRDAFLLAARNGRLDVLKVLLEHNCDVSKRTLTGSDSALHLINFDPEIKPKPVIGSIVNLLLEHGVPLEARNLDGDTALAMSALNGKISIAECLLDRGADFHSTDNDGWTALHWAAQEDHHEVVALLISKGACLETRTKEQSDTPLHVSCFAENGSGESAKLLLEAGADKEAISGFDAQRALHLASSGGVLELVNELLAFELEIDAADDNKWRALHYAKNWGHWRIIEALLAKGANPLLLDKWGDRPSKVGWHPDAKICLEDKEKCLKLLKDAEKAWKEKKRLRTYQLENVGFARMLWGRKT